MSYSSRRDVKAARIGHQCDHCRQPIEVGTPYRYLAFDCEGEFADTHVHHECHEFVLAYTCTDEGWCFLHDIDPSDEWELKEALLADPSKAEAAMARLPNRWRVAVEAVLQGDA